MNKLPLSLTRTLTAPPTVPSVDAVVARTAGSTKAREIRIARVRAGPRRAAATSPRRKDSRAHESLDKRVDCTDADRIESDSRDD